jgi:hypothetical protein
MSSSSTLISILTPLEASTPSSDSLTRATELLDLVKSPTAIATGVLVGFATAQLARNTTGTVDRPRTKWASAAAIAAVALSAAVVTIMTPLAYRVTVSNAGNGVDTKLLVYLLTFAVAIGTTGYCAWTAKRCLAHLGVAFPMRKKSTTK